MSSKTQRGTLTHPAAPDRGKDYVGPCHAPRYRSCAKGMSLLQMIFMDIGLSKSNAECKQYWARLRSPNFQEAGEWYLDTLFSDDSITHPQPPRTLAKNLQLELANAPEYLSRHLKDSTHLTPLQAAARYVCFVVDKESSDTESFIQSLGDRQQQISFVCQLLSKCRFDDHTYCHSLTKQLFPLTCLAAWRTKNLTSKRLDDNEDEHDSGTQDSGIGESIITEDSYNEVDCNSDEDSDTGIEPPRKRLRVRLSLGQKYRLSSTIWPGSVIPYLPLSSLSSPPQSQASISSCSSAASRIQYIDSCDQLDSPNYVRDPELTPQTGTQEPETSIDKVSALPNASGVSIENVLDPQVRSHAAGDQSTTFSAPVVFEQAPDTTQASETHVEKLARLGRQKRDAEQLHQEWQIEVLATLSTEISDKHNKVVVLEQSQIASITKLEEKDEEIVALKESNSVSESRLAEREGEINALKQEQAVIKTLLEEKERETIALEEKGREIAALKEWQEHCRCVLADKDATISALNHWQYMNQCLFFTQEDENDKLRDSNDKLLVEEKENAAAMSDAHERIVTLDERNSKLVKSSFARDRAENDWEKEVKEGERKIAKLEKKNAELKSRASYIRNMLVAGQGFLEDDGDE